jgi:hypothetical protein
MVCVGRIVKTGGIQSKELPLRPHQEEMALIVELVLPHDLSSQPPLVVTLGQQLYPHHLFLSHHLYRT